MPISQVPSVDDAVTQPGRPGRFSSWLVFGVSLALSILDAWIWWWEKPDALGFRLLLGVPLYFTASFCLIWPVLTAIQVLVARFRRAAGIPWLRVLLAALLFSFGWYLSVPLARDEYQSSDLAAKRRQQELERTEDQLSQNILLFQEPLSWSQENALLRFIHDRPVDAGSALQAVQHYSHTAGVLWALAGRADTTPDCLRVIYEESPQLPATPNNNASLSELYMRLGSHPNTPLDVLEKMIHSSQGVWALDNPRLPKAEKVAFLTQAAASDSPSRRAAAARSADTPVAVLRKLSSDPDVSVIRELLNNSRTPEDILKRFTNSEIYHVAAEAALARRQQAAAK